MWAGAVWLVIGRLRRGAQRQLGDGDAGPVEREGDRTQRGRSVARGDHDLVAEVVDLGHAVDRTEDLDSPIVVAIEFGEDDIGADRPLELAGGALGHEAAVVDDADSIGQLIGLLEVLGREEDRHPEVSVQAPDFVPDPQTAGGIEPGRRLVEEQHRRVVHQ
jgi:hypothetical protein